MFRVPIGSDLSPSIGKRGVNKYCLFQLRLKEDKEDQRRQKKTKEDNFPKTNEHPHVHDRLCCCCRTAAPNRRVYACPRKAATDLSEPHPGFNRLRLLGGLATSSNWESPVGDNPVAYSEVIPQGASRRRIVRSRRFKFGRPPHSRHSKNFRGCESFPHRKYAPKTKKDIVRDNANELHALFCSRRR